MLSRKNRRSQKGGYTCSVCPTIKTPEGCSEITICKWNKKLSKCRKAPVKSTSKKYQKKTLECMSLKTKEDCDKNNCLWGAPFCVAYAPNSSS